MYAYSCISLHNFEPTLVTNLFSVIMISDLVKMQSIQINSLKNEVVDLKKTNANFKPKNMTEFGYKLEMQLSKLMEKYLLRYETEHNRKLSSFLAGK